MERHHFAPTLYIHDDSASNAEFRTIHGTPLRAVECKSIKAAKDFIYQLHDSSAAIYGMRRFEYSFIEQNPPTNWDTSWIKVARIDIEVESENGFPEPDRADEKITLISYKQGNRILSFGVGDYSPSLSSVTYFKATDEIHLLRLFLEHWKHDYPDILTGWNAIGFDVPYLVNRIRKILGDDAAKELSPWGIIREINYNVNDNNVKSYKLYGISTMDSIDLYKKYSPYGMSQDSYSLDNISKVELDDSKLDYEEAGSLHNLYKTNFQKYADYNIKDILLDERIANKYDVINLALTVAYMNHVNYDDVFTQVRMWAAIVDREYTKIGVKLDHGKKHHKTFYSGGFVKEPRPGNYRNVVSFDLTSLYPHLIMQYNISPETIVEPSRMSPQMIEFMKQSISVDSILEKRIDTSSLKDLGVTVTPNGQLFSIQSQGVLPKIMEEMFNSRKKNKELQLEAERKLTDATTDEEKEKLKLEIAKYKSLQMALKVCLNSAYGACGSEFFVLFDQRLAEAITTTGRLSVQWIGNRTNSHLQNILKTNADYILAQDTDSMYVWLDDLVKIVLGPDKPIEETINFLDSVCSGPIQKVINEGFEELKEYVNAYSQKMFMKREALASNSFWTGKKRYAMAVWDNEGVRYHEPEIKITGLESKRSSTPPAAREAIKKVVKLVLTEGKKPTQEFIAEFKNQFPSMKLREIAITTGVNGLDRYPILPNGSFTEKTPMHVRASLVYNEYIKRNGLEKEYAFIKNGNKIRYVPLKMPNPTMNDVFAWESFIPDTFDIDEYIDYEELYNRTFYKPVKKIMESFGWTPENIVTIEDFM